MLNISVLMMVVFLMRIKTSMRRILMGAVFLAVVSIFLLSARYVFIKILINMIMIKFVIKSKSVEKIITGTVYEYTISFAITKIFWTLLYIYRYGLIVCIVAVAIVVSICIIYKKIKTTKDNDNIFQVRINNQDISIDVKALYDTGNRLCDPISGKTVSVIESDEYRKITQNQKPENYKVIPYHTIGEEHGVLEAMKVDKITIFRNDERISLKDVIIACYEGKLSKDGSFQMILNKELL